MNDFVAMINSPWTYVVLVGIFIALMIYAWKKT